MFTMCETQKNKNVTHVAHRIKAKQDGRPFLRRNEQSYEPGSESKEVGLRGSGGLQIMGDLEEVYEDSDRSENSNELSESRGDDVNQMMNIVDDDE